MKDFIIILLIVLGVYIGIAIMLNQGFKELRSDYNKCIDMGGKPSFCLTGFK